MLYIKMLARTLKPFESGWEVDFGSTFCQAFYVIWQQKIGGFVAVSESGILALIGITDGQVFPTSACHNYIK